jgi:acetyltransferase-like isoleucine patch superfamily enzyme
VWIGGGAIILLGRDHRRPQRDWRRQHHVRDVLSASVVAGNPARIIRNLDGPEDHRV